MDVNEQREIRRQLGIKRIADFDQSKSGMRQDILAMLDAMSQNDLRECLDQVRAIQAATRDRLPMIQIIANLGITEFNAILAEWLVGSKQEDDGA
jgi:hypothetical protein